MRTELALIGAQVVVVVVLGVCVALGHNSYITDGLMAICGSIAGTGVYTQVKSAARNKADPTE